jgi:hypothetical protein
VREKHCWLAGSQPAEQGTVFSFCNHLTFWLNGNFWTKERLNQSRKHEHINNRPMTCAQSQRVLEQANHISLRHGRNMIPNLIRQPCWEEGPQSTLQNHVTPLNWYSDGFPRARTWHRRKTTVSRHGHERIDPRPRNHEPQ